MNVNTKTNDLLRVLRDEDINIILCGMNQIETRRLIGSHQPFTESEARHIIKEGVTDKQIWLGILNAKQESLCGLIALLRINNVLRSGELSLTVFDPSHQNQGMGTAALTEFLNYIFLCRNLNRVTAQVCDYNERAIRFYRKTGFIEEGRIRQGCYWDGKYSDMIIMGLLHADYIKQKGTN